ncbi:DDE family transposase [Rhizobium sullae]|uniref:DDE family transposase n=1 Tax=Rhizobium sullae TaxID=50338 RepID=A0A4R3QKP1_RHISU|nr:DDE family transposase [Rhizobium sullae]
MPGRPQKRRYDRGKLMDKAAYLDFLIEVVRRIEGQPGVNVLPRRWVVARTFGWMTRWRRLVRDYEAHQRVRSHVRVICFDLGNNAFLNPYAL